MKTLSVKIALLVAILAGLSVALLIYDPVVVFISKIASYVGNTTSIIILFVFSIVATKISLWDLNKDYKNTTALSEITVSKIIKYFLGGFIGCYALISLMVIFTGIALAFLEMF